MVMEFDIRANYQKWRNPPGVKMDVCMPIIFLKGSNRKMTESTTVVFTPFLFVIHIFISYINHTLSQVHMLWHPLQIVASQRSKINDEAKHNQDKFIM